MKKASLERHKSLVQWVSQATGINTFGVKIQLRGNDLHILCEGRDCPQRWQTLSDLLQALQQTDLEMLTKNQEPAIYQVFVYGRTKGEKRPEWCHQVYLNQLDRHLEQVNQALIKDAEKSRINPGGAMIVSNESLARQGHPDAIARYLSETLSTLGVSVEVKVKNEQSQEKGSLEENRLWIFCQSSYTPDPSLIAEPVAQKLRDLKLVGYKDAVIASQVVGETKPDWLLRIDLTPPEVMLKEWARWGDIQAIALLLGAALSELKVTVQASLKESTLHVFCTSTAKEATPDKTACWNAIVTQLEAIAPQGILAATVYGQKTTEQQPDWIDWLNLPASQHPALSTSAMELASSGDEPAIHFLIERLLNPDLNLRLKTGGIRVLLLRKGDLLHVMCDAPICPGRKKVAPKVTQCVRQLQIPNIIGVRVYGRRAGNKEPFWNYGVDFQQRQLLAPEATPEFAATSAYVNELLPSDSSEPILRPDLTTEEIHTFVTEVARDWGATARKSLLATQLFIEQDSTEQNADYQGLKTALVWGTLGLLLTLQTDWILGQTVALTRQKPTDARVVLQSSSVNDDENQDERTAFFADTSGKKSPSATSVFNASGFTKHDNTLPRAKATATAILLAARSQMPSFNARQLDEQLALYKQRLAKTGTPPKILIIGSSRALRGIDPAALDKALATQGYHDVDVFNFGINGATAKVVDFIIRRVLEPSELPKIIIWADGSRAFNSGRDDATFQAIAASAGYQQAIQKVLASSTNDVQSATKEQQKTKAENQNVNSYQAINQSLNEALANVSATYQQRDQFKAFLSKEFKSLPIISSSQPATSDSQTTANLEEDPQQAVDFDGFLPLSIRFNPRNYYQKHPKVSGNYDNDYKSFQIVGEQDAAFQAVLEFTQAKKISLVFVNMPLTKDYLDPVRIKYEQEFQQYMTSQVANSSLIYRDLTKLFPQTSKNFSDPSHLNRFGAYEVSKKLANDPMIPWTTK
ncbi:DUF1574 family protein [Scytonema hofmannii FACHB-248]|uniref:DUF1574 family protein n=1 Tax=Scytonema hofmannii FACHB-248 TaxID=1842502 RepID=A0ABR8GYJ8_9CYAN|nr:MULTISPECIES: DUF1574 family protein [Nostocales]MBD2608214.1 DUF1574 family protein [Scytonema hofmannii FACHB-248]